MSRKTKVRIVGDPTLVKLVGQKIQEAFDTDQPTTYNTTPARYAQSPGITMYLTVKKMKVSSDGQSRF